MGLTSQAIRQVSATFIKSDAGNEPLFGFVAEGHSVMGKQMGVIVRRLVLLAILLGTVGFATGPAAAGPKKCLDISGTGDGINKQVAVESSRRAIKTEIEKLQTENHITTFESKAWKPDPRPYWRSSVSDYLSLAPDEATDQVYTICWKGVVSPAVCTSGTEVCWPTN
jgi:hypothetical protein